MNAQWNAEKECEGEIGPKVTKAMIVASLELGMSRPSSNIEQRNKPAAEVGSAPSPPLRTRCRFVWP